MTPSQRVEFIRSVNLGEGMNMKEVYRKRFIFTAEFYIRTVTDHFVRKFQPTTIPMRMGAPAGLTPKIALHQAMIN